MQDDSQQRLLVSSSKLPEPNERRSKNPCEIGKLRTPMFERQRISFRPLHHSDLRLMFGWLRNPEVARWYGPTPEILAELEAKYEPRIEGRKPVFCYVVEYDGNAVGYIQTYMISHEPEYAAALDVDPHAAGVDLFIGEDVFRHRGFGPLLLQEFVGRIVFNWPDASCCVIAPESGNSSAIRAYERAGFRHVKTVRVPGEEEPEYVMILWPGELEAAVTRLDQEQYP